MPFMYSMDCYSKHTAHKQAYYERERAVLVRLLAMQIARNVAL